VNGPVSVLESAALELLSARAGEHAPKLREQISKIQVTDRRRDRSGLFSYFEVPKYLVAATIPEMRLSGIKGTHPKLKDGADFILFVQWGAVAFLEAYTFSGEPWPESEDEMKLDYHYRL
jgi:hypothetical protein